MESIKNNWLLYTILIIGILVIYFKPQNSEIKQEQKDYDKKLDSITTLVDKREAIEHRITHNVTNNIIENKTNKTWYSQSDSLRLRFIDSVFEVEGL